MVALAGRGWQLAPCLVSLVDEANDIAPKRIRTADGSIGDLAHASRASDHNPSGGYVTAVDLTHAPASGFDAHARARMVVARRDHRIKYVISNRQIARGYAKPGIPAWTWVPYTGANAHVAHAHFSVVNTPNARDDRSPWWPTNPRPVTPPPPVRQEDDVMADPQGAARFLMRTYLGRGPKDQAELDFHAGEVKRLGVNGYIVWLEVSKEAQAWARRIGAEVRTPDA